MRRAAAAVLAVAVTVLAACGNGGDGRGAASVLDGRPRIPDVAGVVGDVQRESIEIDGRTYPLSPDLESFSTYDGELSSIFERPGQYVHAGVVEGEVRWVAGVGLPAGDPPRVFFGSRVTKVRGDAVEFTGGTVLRLAPGVDAPRAGEVEASIDVGTDRVVEVRSVTGGPGA